MKTKISLISVLFLLICVACHDDKPVVKFEDKINSTDREILMNIYNILGLENDPDYHWWGAPGAAGRWKDITFEYFAETKEYRVIAVSLPLTSNQSQNQAMLDQIASLDSLREFNLEVPTGQTLTIPDEIYDRNLRIFFIKGPGVSNVTADGLIKLAGSVSEVSITHAGLDNPFLEAIISYDGWSLWTMDLSNNKFTGTVPKDALKIKCFGIVAMHQRGINLSDNQFSQINWAMMTSEDWSFIPILLGNPIEGPWPIPDKYEYVINQNSLSIIMISKLKDTPLYSYWKSGK